MENRAYGIDFTSNDSTVDIHYQQYKKNGEEHTHPVSISVFSENGNSSCNPVFLTKEDCRDLGNFLIEIYQGTFES